MGFFFDLLILLFFLLSIVGTFIYYIISKNKKALITILILVIGIILLFIFDTIARREPIKLNREGIIGEYRIDTTFYPGKNARWQYYHYRFSITENDSITLIHLNDSSIPIATYKYKIRYTDGPPDIWSVDTNKAYHIVAHHPILFRSYNRFYYVLRSDKYGNMFFRKQ